MTIYLECYTILYTVPCLPPCSYSYFKGGYCYYNLIIFLMMQTYLFVIMILLFRVIIIPLCITVSWVAYCVHDLRVGILVIYPLLRTYLSANIPLCFILILWHCIPLQPRVFMTLLLWVGILVISTYFIVCTHSLASLCLLLFNIFLHIVIVRLWYYVITLSYLP